MAGKYRAPSAWNEASELAHRSAREPDARLELEAVYGYGGLANLAPNVFYSSSGEVVYYTAAVGIVLDKEAQAQRFFRGHSDDIHCLALDPSRTIAATGQTADRELGGRPFVCVWDVHSLQELSKLVHGKVNRVAAVGFSADGKLLATVGCSAPQSVCVWQWARQIPVRRLAAGGRPTAGPGAAAREDEVDDRRLFWWASTGIQPEPRDEGGQVALSHVYGVRWHPDGSGRFVTHGKAHAHLWGPGQGERQALNFGAEPQDVLSLLFLPGKQGIVGGMPDGSIFHWGASNRVLRSAHRGQVRSLLLRGSTLMSACTRGVICEWDVTAPVPALSGSRKLAGLYEGDPPPAIRALDARPGSDIFVIGTNRCELWEVDREPSVLVAGHVADLAAVDAHPRRPELFATADKAERAYVWDARERCMRGLTEALPGESVRCLAWAPLSGSVLALATVSAAADERSNPPPAGSVSLFDANRAIMPLVASARVGREPSALRFSPDGRRLAVGSRGGPIELFTVLVDGVRHLLLPLAVCEGHSTTVRTLDWAADGSVLQSSCQARQLLYWDGASGRRLSQEPRGCAWRTWSSMVGWPVLGIWPEGYDNSDINAVDRSAAPALAPGVQGGHVVAADDFGSLLLFNHPCVLDGAAHLRYGGHSSHVTGVRFLRGSQRCVSIGGRDRAVFQWALEPDHRAAADARHDARVGARATAGAVVVMAEGAADDRGDRGVLAGTARGELTVAPARGSKLLVGQHLRAPPSSAEASLERAVLRQTPRYDAPRFVGKLCAKLTRHQPAELADAMGEPLLSKLFAHLGAQPLERVHFERLRERYPAAGGSGEPAVSARLLVGSLFAEDGRRRTAVEVRGAPRRALDAPPAPLVVQRFRALLHPPTDAKGARAAAERSALPPDARLELEAVYGYGGLTNLAPNVFYSSSGEVVYYTAAVGIVLDKEAQAQRFFRGHSDDIHCLALDPSRTIAATGQTADRELGGRPFVCVWDVHSLQELSKLVHGKVNRVAAVGFSADGKLLATVGCSAPQSVCVWDWRRERPLFEVSAGVQPAPRDLEGHMTLSSVFGVKWAPSLSPHARAQLFITHGKAHLRWWGRAPKDVDGMPEWHGEAAIFGAAVAQADVLCAEFLPNGDVASGTAAGELLIWRNWRVLHVLPAQPRLAPGIQPELRVLALRPSGRELLTGGGGGVICEWELTGEVPLQVPSRTRRMHPAFEGERPPAIRSLDARPGSDIFVIGTSRCELWEVDSEPSMLVAGHVADLAAVDAHPRSPELFMTAAEGERAYLWDASERRLRGVTERLSGERIQCLAFQPPAGKVVALGTVDAAALHPDAQGAGPPSARGRRGPPPAPAPIGGTIFLLATTGGDGVIARVGQTALRREPSALRFSPDGRRLAVGSRGGPIELFTVLVDGVRHLLLPLAVCEGHSTTVRTLDWAADGSVLQSSCQARQLLYWDGASGRRLSQEPRGCAWRTWSSMVGWPVLGIWPEGYDNSDINAVDRSAAPALAPGVQGGHVVAADDFGSLLLFNHPCVLDGAAHLRYGGHSSHVTGVRFLRGSQRCVSIGGRDRAVFQWALEPDHRAAAHDLICRR